jgi:hypothetical protein
LVASDLLVAAPVVLVEFTVVPTLEASVVTFVVPVVSELVVVDPSGLLTVSVVVTLVS